LLASIRENILERFKYNKTIKNCSEFDIPSKLNDVEILSLLENLKEIGFVSFRDQKEKKKLLNGIKTKYESDAFITLLELVPGRHYLDLMEAVNNLPPTAKEAVIYISALHQFNILMPVGLLRVLISKDWDIFRNEFLSIDCKKIVIEVEDELYSSNSDLYFKIKHPIIAKNIIERFISNKDDLYKLYFKLLSNVFNSVVNSRVVNDLLKLLRYNDYFNLEKLNKLYDVTYSQMSEDPYFLLYYSINLQRRNTFEDLKKAITLILYAESFFQRKNHRFIHRRAVLNFQIAKMLYEVFEKTELIETYEYLTESEELFKIKLLLDPCSSYSFCEYIEFLFWKIDNLNLSSEEDLRNRIRIEELVDLAERTVFDNIDRVLILKQQYISKYQGTMKKDDYLKKLLGFYEDESFRPLALILLYNLYEQMGQN
ncbi:MAG: hypothetical protein Q8M94_07490, partial [Ignavibacteria bacterium]|nr:hypothetical protein [Ignavibacteria bacterium]